MDEFFRNKSIIITGGTGSLGQEIVKKLVDFPVKTIRIFSRDEWKQNEMKNKLNDNRLRFFIGDIRDKERLSRAMEDIDIVIHTAALKQIPVTEYNPFEAIKTNVDGTQNLIECCLDHNVETVLGVSTDKAVSPINTYGATKLLMERLFISANHYKGNHKTKFLCVRYGNVLGSRGSVIPVFIEQIKQKNKVCITDPSMTRFNITMKEAIELIFRALRSGEAGDIIIPKLKSYNLGELKNAIIEIVNSNAETEVISVRYGEKFHESLINKDEIQNTFENETDYIIIDSHLTNVRNINRQLKKATLDKDYSSDKVQHIPKEKLKEILIEEKFFNN